MKPRTQKEKRVLGFCNRVRSKFGGYPRTELREGRRHRARECPIANTIGNGAIIGTASMEFVMNADSKIYLPKYVQEFISSFDRCKIPDLDLDVIEREILDRIKS